MKGYNDVQYEFIRKKKKTKKRKELESYINRIFNLIS